MDIFAILEGLISSAPEAIALYQRIVPLLSKNAAASDDEVTAVNDLAPVAIAAVQTLHAAIAQVVTSHTVPSTMWRPPAAPPATA